MPGERKRSGKGGEKREAEPLGAAPEPAEGPRAKGPESASQSALMKAWLQAEAEAQSKAGPAVAPPESKPKLEVAAPVSGAASVFGEPEAEAVLPAPVPEARERPRSQVSKFKVALSLFLIVGSAGFGFFQWWRQRVPAKAVSREKSQPQAVETRKPGRKAGQAEAPKAERAQPAGSGPSAPAATPTSGREPGAPATAPVKPTAAETRPHGPASELRGPSEAKPVGSRFLLPASREMPEDWAAARASVEISGIMKSGSEVAAFVQGQIVKKGAEVTVGFRGKEYRFVVADITSRGVDLEPAEE